MTILKQYHRYRQSGSLDLLFQLADRLGCLSDHERIIGKLPYSRYGAVSRRVESALGNPEQILTNAIYLKLYETGVQSGCYTHGIGDDVLTAYCQLRSKGYWTGRLTTEEKEAMRPIDDLENHSSYPVSDAVEEAIAQYFGNLQEVA